MTGSGNDGESGRRFEWPVRVYYEDTDCGGRVYYANYLKFMERARTEWLRALGFGQGALSELHGVQLVVSRLSMEFHAPAGIDDMLRVDVRMRRCGGASMDLEQAVYREPAELLCRAEIKLVCIDIQCLKPCAIPPLVMAEFILDGSPRDG